MSLITSQIHWIWHNLNFGVYQLADWTFTNHSCRLVVSSHCLFIPWSFDHKQPAYPNRLKRSDPKNKPRRRHKRAEKTQIFFGKNGTNLDRWCRKKKKRKEKEKEKKPSSTALPPLGFWSFHSSCIFSTPHFLSLLKYFQTPVVEERILLPV
uniref:Uncharacterized protein n=1 Tax=Cucumis sativus TaxID=3659 RepID=A0A0A0K8R9_CUCSA